MKNKHFDDGPIQDLEYYQDLCPKCFNDSLEQAFNECKLRGEQQINHIFKEIIELEKLSRLQNVTDSKGEGE